MKQGTYHRSRRLGSAMGRIAEGSPGESPGAVFERATALAITRRLVPRDNVSAAYAFADAFLVAWLRRRDRKDTAARIRRGLIAIARTSGVDRAALPRPNRALP